MENEHQKQSSPTPIRTSNPINQKGSKKKQLLGLFFLFDLIVIAVLIFALNHRSPSPTQQSTNSNTKQAMSSSATSGLTLDENKNYGNKYANGLLPVGDKKYTTNGAKKGYIYLCNANFVPEGQAGAQQRGPWFVNNNTQWDINKKTAISGSVSWQQKLDIKVDGDKRIITTNDLPDHHTGTFPESSSDPARKYDSNPNKISEQSLSYQLTASPKQSTPQCMTGEVGVMLTGVALFNGFDAGGRDAGAWEVQDDCDGHPQNKGEYHYHTMSRCITDVRISKVIGYALDGFPITGPRIGENNILTTDDLDECHGIVSDITIDGKKTKSYHYVMTEDFPYSVSCFKATATKPPGQPENGGQQPGNAANPQQAPPAGQRPPRR